MLSPLNSLIMRNVIHLKPFFSSDLEHLELPEILKISHFKGALGQSIVNSDSDAMEVFIGLGAQEDFCPEHLRIAVGSLAHLNLEGHEIALDSLLQRLTPLLPDRISISIVTATLMACHPDLRVTHKGSQSHSPTAGIEARAIRLATEITNASGTAMNPHEFAATVRRLCVGDSVKVEVISGHNDLMERGFPAVAAMGAGSPYEPQFIRIDYLPHLQDRPIVLVGKGVTFDTGGLSLKSPAAMTGMRHDICGAATVLSVVSCLHDLQIPVPVTALLPVIENMVGPSSIRPGDDIATRSGVPLRILDTDFEGRVILADALTFASELNPLAIVDFATLTYQAVTALGPEIAAFFSNSDDLADIFMESAHEAGESFWRLPLASQYKNQIRTSIGLKNHPETDSGRAITAALLLNEFVGSQIPWIHIDATGPTWKGLAGGDGATGFGVSTLLRLLRNASKL